MHVAVTTEFVANKKQSLAELLDSLHAAVLPAESCEPAVQFLFSDRPGSKVSTVNRVLNRVPALAVFETSSKGTRIYCRTDRARRWPTGRSILQPCAISQRAYQSPFRSMES